MQVMSVIRADIEEHKGSAVGNHLREQYDLEPDHIAQSEIILRKCQNKFDSLLSEILFLYQRPTANAKQSDSIGAKFNNLDQFIKPCCCLLLVVFSLIILL